MQILGNIREVDDNKYLSTKIEKSRIIYNINLWHIYVITYRGMDTDDNIYVICLLASIIVGNYVRCIKNKSYAKMVHSALGVTIVTFVCGWQSWHCFISCILGGLAASKSPIKY